VESHQRLRIAVCDFKEFDCDYTADVIRLHYMHEGLDMPEITKWTEDTPFRENLKSMADRGERYDMVFVGADSIIGTDLARTVRDYDKSCPLFLVSRAVEFAVEGFRIQALDYLTKPVSPRRVGEAIERIDQTKKNGGDELWSRA